MSYQGHRISGILAAHVYIPVFLRIFKRMNEITLTPILGVGNELGVKRIYLLEVVLEHQLFDDGDTVPVRVSTVGPVDVGGVLVAEEGYLGVFFGVFL